MMIRRGLYAIGAALAYASAFESGAWATANVVSLLLNPLGLVADAAACVASTFCSCQVHVLLWLQWYSVKSKSIYTL